MKNLKVKIARKILLWIFKYTELQFFDHILIKDDEEHLRLQSLSTYYLNSELQFLIAEQIREALVNLNKMNSQRFRSLEQSIQSSSLKINRQEETINYITRIINNEL